MLNPRAQVRPLVPLSASWHLSSGLGLEISAPHRCAHPGVWSSTEAEPVGAEYITTDTIPTNRKPHPGREACKRGTLVVHPLNADGKSLGFVGVAVEGNSNLSLPGPHREYLINVGP